MILPNRRRRAMMLLILILAGLAALLLAGALLEEAASATHFENKNLPPSLAHPFGTDRMGRDMLARTVAGLSLSLRLGLLTSAVSALLALALGLAAATLGRRADSVISWAIDLVMGVPHILLLVLISLACGRGFWGVAAGVSLTHWPSLARLIRGEVLQLRQAPYIQAARQLGHPAREIAWRYMAPHLFPQFLTGLILAFPHAILHEASITFLGFGLPAEIPAIGVILSEGLSYLVAGRWWLALLPGLALAVCVFLFALLGDNIRRLLDPASIHE